MTGHDQPKRPVTMLRNMHHINRNRKAERDIERAQAAITATVQQPEVDAPVVSPDSIQTVVKPHRRKK